MALIKCKECGHEVSDKASECPHCGCPISQEKSNICKECGEPIPENASVCPNCGCPIENNEAVQEVYYDEEPEKKKWWIWALVIALLCLGGGYYAYAKHFKGENDKDAIVELTPEFINSIQKYNKLGSFSEGYAAVLKDEKWGYINTKGEEVISCQYSNPYEEYTSGAFHEGLAAVQKDGKWGYINTKGEEVIPINLDVQYANFFSDGLAVIINDYNNFSVIDTKGNVVFKGNCDFEQFGEDMVYEMQQNYVKGKLYIPVESDKYAVYDMQGNKLGEESTEQEEDFIKQNSKVLYKIYSDEREGNTSLGLIDVDGKVIVPATYDRIGDKVGGNVDFSNGVILVMLEEIGEDVMEGYAGEIYSPDTKYHYGYVDLKGKDTFSNELKQKCKNSKEQALQKIKQQEEEFNSATDNYEWLQGTWTINVNIMGQTKLAKLVIEGNYATFYSDGEILDRGEYKIYDGEIHFGSTHAYIDEERELIKYDDNHYYSHSSQSTTSVNALTPEKEKELKIMTKLHELGEKGKSLVSELSAMRQRGQMDPARYLYIKQALIQYKDEQIRLSQELGDEQMAREYMQQKDGVLQSFRMIENGY